MKNSKLNSFRVVVMTKMLGLVVAVEESLKVRLSKTDPGYY